MPPETPFDLKFTSREVTAWGGLALLKRMLDGMGFKDALQSWQLPQPGSNRGYAPEQLIKQMIVSNWCGAARFAHADSDQGTQFTSEAFTGVLKREGVTISMDGRGRAFDNIFVERLWCSVKHEDVYLNGYATMGELLIGLTKYFAFYNGERAHQALTNQTPDAVHASAVGGGAMIVDKYGAKQELPGLPIALRSTGTAFGEVRVENESEYRMQKPGQRRAISQRVSVQSV